MHPPHACVADYDDDVPSLCSLVCDRVDFCRDVVMRKGDVEEDILSRQDVRLEGLRQQLVLHEVCMESKQMRRRRRLGTVNVSLHLQSIDHGNVKDK